MPTMALIIPPNKTSLIINIAKTPPTTTYLFVPVFERQRGPLHLLQKVLPVLLVLVGRHEDHLQPVPVLGGLLEAAVELRQAGVELAARRVLAAAEVEADQRQPAAQRLHVHVGLLGAHQPLPEQAHQELRHRRAGSFKILFLAFSLLLTQTVGTVNGSDDTPPLLLLSPPAAPPGVPFPYWHPDLRCWSSAAAAAAASSSSAAAAAAADQTRLMGEVWRNARSLALALSLPHPHPHTPLPWTTLVFLLRGV